MADTGYVIESMVIFSSFILTLPLLPANLGPCVFSIIPLNTTLEGLLSDKIYSL